MTKKITIDKSFVLSSAYEDYKYLLEFMPGYPIDKNPGGNYKEPGTSDYPFYAYFSTFVNNTTILEVGTSHGGSATMLSHNKNNKVITYDIVDILMGSSTKENIEFRIGNFMKDIINYDEIDLIAIDVDPHDGNQETEMIDYLEKVWKGGLLVLDDIHNGGGMQQFWNGIDRERHELFDISDIAHGSLGTGLVNFNRYYEVNLV